MANTQEDYSDLGFIPHDQIKDDYSDLGFIPHANPEEASKYQMTPDVAYKPVFVGSDRPEEEASVLGGLKQNINRLQGAGAALGNMAVSTVNLPDYILKHAAYGLNKLTGLEKLVGQPELPTLERGLIGGFEAPAEGTAGREGYEAANLAGALIPAAGMAEKAGIAKLMADKLPLLAEKAPGAAMDAVEATKNAVPKLTNFLKINPEKLSENLINEITEGKGLEQNAKELASLIKKTGKEKIGISAQNYKPIMEEVGEKSILGNMPIKESTKILSPVDTEIYDSYPGKLKDIRNAFIENPTFSNAHDFQSQLGSAIRDINKRPFKSTYDYKQLNEFSKIRDTLKQSQADYLKNNAPHLVDKYKSASDWHLENVIPYRENAAINKIVSGKVTNPRNVPSIFRNPEENVQKIVSDLGEVGLRKILASEVGKAKGGKPQKLLDLFEKLDQKGLDTYQTADMESKLSDIQNAINRKAKLGKIAEIAGYGGAIGGAMGVLKSLLGG